MDLINKFLNMVAPPLTFFSICLLLPPTYFYKLFLSTLSSVFCESLSGKVVLITGASSGIGEVIIISQVHLENSYGRRWILLFIYIFSKVYYRVLGLFYYGVFKFLLSYFEMSELNFLV